MTTSKLLQFWVICGCGVKRVVGTCSSCSPAHTLPSSSDTTRARHPWPSASHDLPEFGRRCPESGGTGTREGRLRFASGPELSLEDPPPSFLLWLSALQPHHRLRPTIPEACYPAVLPRSEEMATIRNSKGRPRINARWPHSSPGGTTL